MVEMLLKMVVPESLGKLGESLLVGDICGGTGRFVHGLARRLTDRGVPQKSLERAARLFDQSLMAVDLAKLNFLFEGMKPTFERVGDSLIAAQVGGLKGKFLLLATNPPFGAGKYRWNKELGEVLPSEVLSAIGMRSQGDSADPSEFFFFRNLDLLAPGGVLAIVLPDGVVQSEDLKKALTVYERVRNTNLHVAAIVSLPSVTFSLGGTVAKTSFLIVQKQDERQDKPIYAALAHHVGFVKRGKKRGDDPEGNDLIKFAAEYGSGASVLGRVVECWRTHELFIAAKMMHVEGESLGKMTPLADLVRMMRDFKSSPGTGDQFHVSVLDVDATGLIDMIAASRNQPMSKGLACQPGDILVSCMNPKIWRVAVIPNMSASWSCSPEFVVLRPKPGQDSWRIALALHHPNVVQAVQAMAKGTSSSRQRVPKDRVLTVSVPELTITAKKLAEYVAWREEFYAKRLREAHAYDGIRGGDDRFEW